MGKYILSRLLRSVITLVVIISVVFSLLRLMPVEGYFGAGYDKLAPEVVDAYLESIGLKDPLYKQLFDFYKTPCKVNLASPSITVKMSMSPRSSHQK